MSSYDKPVISGINTGRKFLTEIVILGQKMGKMGDIRLLCPYPFEEVKTLLQ